MAFVQESGTVHFPMASNVSPFKAMKLMQETFPDLEQCAGLDMEGELRIGEASTNRRGAVGPAESQLFPED